MTIKERVYQYVGWAKERGRTVPDFLERYPDLLPQTVYPCFTQLCKAKKILDSKQRRKSKNNRRSIVWVDAQYGGVVPVWGSGHPSYAYKNRAKIIMDLLARHGALSVSEMMTVAKELKPMSTSSLVSHLVRQQWLHKTRQTRRNEINQTCRLYDLTPRGRQVMTNSPRYSLDTNVKRPNIRKETEKTHG